MTISVDAIYENGIFKPAHPVDLDDGAHVLLTIDSESPAASPQEIFAALEEIAAMPAQSPDDGFSAADHDLVLYPRKGT